MSSTSFNVGLSDDTRLSSRVLRPPGGGHTDIFSGDPEPPRGRRFVPSASGVLGAKDEPSKPANGTAAPEQNGQSTAESPEPETAQPETAQPETPAPKAVTTQSEQAKAEPAKVEPPKRVRVPPGGFSSGLW